MSKMKSVTGREGGGLSANKKVKRRGEEDEHLTEGQAESHVGSTRRLTLFGALGA